MPAIHWSADHPNEAHGCAVDLNGDPGLSVFDIQKKGDGGVSVYDYVNSQPFDTAHLKTVEQAKAACELRYKGWLEKMGLVSIAVQDEDQMLARFTDLWRTRDQIEAHLFASGIDMGAKRIERALSALQAMGRIEVQPNATGEGASVYRLAR